MSFDPNFLVNPAMLKLKPYQPGKPICECQRELGLSHIVKLASNENPLGTSPHVLKMLAKELGNVSRYPDGSAYALKNALAAFLMEEPEQLIFGNGSEDVLRMLMQTFLWGDYHVIMPEYAFIAYKILAKSLNVAVKEIPTHHFSMDLNDILAAITEKTRVVIFANPNNPTGTYITHSQLKAFLQKCPIDVMVVCDEAYHEYMLESDYPDTLTLLKSHPNLFITRTFSKAYGLAGLRVGYGVGNEKVIDLINRVRQPFNVNYLAQMAARFALEDQEFVQRSVMLNEQGKKQLYQGFSALGLQYIPSFGNFIMVHTKPTEQDFFQALLKLGIIIRPLGPYHLEEYVRISIGTEEENKELLAALEQILQKERVT